MAKKNDFKVLRDKKGNMINNPFLFQEDIETKEVLTKIKDLDVELVKKGTQTIIEEHIVYAAASVVDKAAFIKFYDKGIKVLKEVSGVSHDVLVYILDNCLEFNRDMFAFSKGDYIVNTRSDVSERSIDRALSTLKQLGIISPIPDYSNMYYINIFMFFKGERRWLFYKYNINMQKENERIERNKSDDLKLEIV